MTKGVTKAQFRIEAYEDVIPIIYKAYDIATSGEPGPVFIEMPVNMQMFEGNVDQMPAYTRRSARSCIYTP
jgi:acetolactate synthase-1/2/3 large subunit